MHTKADLHIHSNASDGDYRPVKIVSMAFSKGISTISLTDHDTISGLKEALDAGIKHQIRVIPGIELSIQYDPGTYHLLGYFPDIPLEMETELRWIQEQRKKRLPKIVEKLNEAGCRINMDDIMNIAGSSQPGRPHVAKALIKKGYVNNFREAFSIYLAKGKKAFVEKKRLPSTEGIHMIRKHGGIPVLAHPFTLGLGEHGLKSFIRELKTDGLKGIEIHYPEHTKAQKRFYTTIAEEFGLFETGGTDYHGPGRNSVSIGDYGINTRLLDSLLKDLS